METYSFGRKESNFVSFPDDQHLSGIHSKIFKIKGKWYIEDIATTNGYTINDLEHGLDCHLKEYKVKPIFLKTKLNSNSAPILSMSVSSIQIIAGHTKMQNRNVSIAEFNKKIR